MTMTMIRRTTTIATTIPAIQPPPHPPMGAGGGSVGGGVVVTMGVAREKASYTSISQKILSSSIHEVYIWGISFTLKDLPHILDQKHVL